MRLGMEVQEWLCAVLLHILLHAGSGSMHWGRSSEQAGGGLLSPEPLWWEIQYTSKECMHGWFQLTISGGMGHVTREALLRW